MFAAVFRSSSTSLCILSTKTTRFMSSSTTKSVSGTVGIIGLGHMGGPMAVNAVKACERVIVYDVNKDSVSKAVSQGAIEAKSLADFKDAHTILTMLPANEHVSKVYEGEGGLFSISKQGTTFIDSSTVSPVLVRKLAQVAESKQSFFFDAPVSGGVLGAANGTLTFMIGGDESGVNKIRPFLSSMGKNLVSCGATGNGQVAKLCNNLVLAISMIGVAEGMNLGKQLGIDSKVLASIFNTSTARCWSSDTYNPCPGVLPGVPSSRNYEGGFGVDLMLKDLGLAIEAGMGVKQPLPATALASQLYSLASALGNGKRDFGVIYEVLSKSK